MYASGVATLLRWIGFGIASFRRPNLMASFAISSKSSNSHLRMTLSEISYVRSELKTNRHKEGSSKYSELVVVSAARYKEGHFGRKFFVLRDTSP